MADVDAGPPVTDRSPVVFGGKGGVAAFEIVAEPDTNPPTIENVTPATGTTIDPTDDVGFDITDPGGTIAALVVYARFASGLHEMIHDGSGFSPRYSGTRTAITDGFRFLFTRSVGWTEAPRIRVVAYDSAGNALVLA